MLLSILVFSILDVVTATSILNVQAPGFLFQNKCIELLGCFYTGPPFYDRRYRPISVSPTSNLQTQYFLFTPSNPQNSEEIEPTEESIQSSSIDESLPVKVLIHGFNTNPRESMFYNMKDAILEEGDYNVIVLDWSRDNRNPYQQAVANARAVGAQVALLINLITEQKSVDASDIHLIGHSLGAHLSGWAGERIPNLGRISGLDPAGPYFERAENPARLDSTDAEFVDIIHTDAGGYGLDEPIGHQGFYPNGGKNQPGCFLSVHRRPEEDSDDNGETERQIMSVCGHLRAVSYYLESINSECQFKAVRCNSYAQFRLGRCLPRDSTVAEMGFHATNIPEVPVASDFFLRTASRSPFCIANSEYPYGVLA